MNKRLVNIDILKLVKAQQITVISFRLNSFVFAIKYGSVIFFR